MKLIEHMQVLYLPEKKYVFVSLCEKCYAKKKKKKILIRESDFGDFQYFRLLSNILMPFNINYFIFYFKVVQL